MWHILPRGVVGGGIDQPTDNWFNSDVGGVPEITEDTVPPASATQMDCPRHPAVVAADPEHRANTTFWVPDTFTGHATFPLPDAVAAIAAGYGGDPPDLTTGDYVFIVFLDAGSGIGAADGGYTACLTPTIFDEETYADYEDGYSTATLDSGIDLVTIADGTPAAFAMDAGGFGLDGDNLVLVNPTGSWSVPDVEDNTAGSVLWTYEELVAAAATWDLGFDWEVYWTGHDTASHISASAGILAYTLDGSGNLMMVL